MLVSTHALAPGIPNGKRNVHILKDRLLRCYASVKAIQKSTLQVYNATSLITIQKCKQKLQRMHS